MAFEIAFKEAGKFKKIVEGMSRLLDEVAFGIKEEGLFVKAMDPSRVALVVLELPADSEIFEKYEVDYEETIGVNMDHFKRFLKRGKDKDTLVLRKGDDNVLDIIFKGSSTRKFRMTLIDVEELELDLPELPFTAQVIVEAGEIQEAIKDASLLTDAVKFIADEDMFIIKAVGETSEFQMTLTPESANMSIKVEAATASGYGLNYLTDIFKTFKKGDEVTLKFGDDIPLQVEAEVGDGKLIFLLAPRLVDE